ncbi:MAG: hypothetical protein COB53_00605 [Elusimicrobia bacterium]|nr:MAG: hypothetical protein COB53_00605 [Elusimicrobiota bacterium]
MKDGNSKAQTIDRAKRTRFSGSLILAGLLAALIPLYAQAEIHIRDSLQWQAADSDLIVQGKVLNVRKSEPFKEEGGGISVWEDVFIQPSAVLKGRVPKRRLHIRWKSPNAPDFSAERWKASEHEHIFFLRKAQFPGRLKKEWTLRTGVSDAVDLDAAKAPFWPVVSQDFTVPDTRRKILNALKRWLRHARRRRYEVKQVEAPDDSAASQALFSGSAVYLRIPVERHK